MTQTLTSPKQEIAAIRTTSPLPREKMKPKINRVEFIKNHTPTTDIIQRIFKKPHLIPFVIKINPDEALDLLTLNDTGQNRNIKEKKIALYTSEMSAHNWPFAGDPLRVTKKGKFIDGQHRLWANYESGTTQEYVMITGLEEDTFSFIDIGATRTAADIISINNFKTNATQLAYAVKNVLMFQTQSKLGSAVSADVITNQMVNKFTRNKANMNVLNDFLGKAQAKWGKETKYFTNGQWATLAYILWKLQWSSELQQKKVTKFINSLVEGAELPRESPIFKLRKWLETYDTHFPTKQRRKLANNVFAYKAKHFFNAWDKYIRNEKGGDLDPDLDRIEIAKPKSS